MALIKTPGGEFYLEDSQFTIDYDNNVVRLTNEGGEPGEAGVQSFNGRTGAVVPQEGDYTAEQVGAVPVSGGTMTGPLNLAGEPTNDLEAATKGYVDGVRDALNNVSETVNRILDGTEALPYLPDDYQPPVASAQSAGVVKVGSGINVTPDGTISVDAQSGITQTEADDRYLKLDGGTMTGSVNMGSNKITGSYTPSENVDLTSKGYVDGVVKVVSDEVDKILTGESPVAVPVATDSHVGGIKVGTGLSVTADGTLSVTQSQETGITQEEADARYVQLSGSDMTGNLSMGNNQVKNVADATEDSDAVSKHQMDEAIAAAVPSAMLESLPDQFMEGIYNVTRTATTNVAQIRLYIKQEDGTYSPDEQHGVLTLIPAGHGPDDIDGAGLMTYADKVKLDAIPAASAENNGKILVVENGAYTFKTLAELQGV